MKQEKILHGFLISIKSIALILIWGVLFVHCLGNEGDKLKFKFLFKLGSIVDSSSVVNNSNLSNQAGFTVSGGKSVFNQIFYTSKTASGDYGFNTTLSLENIPDGTELRICLNDADCLGSNLLYQGILNSNTQNLDLDITIPPGFPVNLGANTLNLTLSRNGQIIGRRSSSFIYDNLAPVLSFSVPTGTYTSQQNVSVTCNDPISGCNLVAYTIDGQDPAISLVANFDPLQIILGNTYVSPLTFGNGVTVLKVTAADLSGNVAGPIAATYTINIAAPPGPIPTLTLNSVQNAITNQTNPTSVNWTSDTPGNYYIVPFGTNCQTITPAVTIVSGNLGMPGTLDTVIPTGGFGQGVNQLKLCLLDSWNQDASFTFNVTKDTIAPTLSSSAPLNNAIDVDVFNRTILFTFNENMQPDTSIEFHVFITYGTGSNLNTVELTVPASASSAWITSTVLRLDLDSILPEFTSIRIQVLTSDLKDLAGNSIAGDAFGFLNLVYTSGGSISLRTIIDTNQPNCHNGTGGGIACAGTGQDGAFAATPNAQVLNNPVFLSGYAADPITVDITSGLTWKTCVQGMTWAAGSCTGAADVLIWPNAISSCASLNEMNGNQGYAGLKNWRLAKIDDFHSLITFPHASSGSAIVPAGKFPGIPNVEQRFWSSTTYRADTSYAYNVRIFGGRIFTHKKSDSTEGAGFEYHALCVTGN
ncbi:DUF1566 domain-containing protein [Leptospira yasudae]|uniref:DUF1566 domain-containing protein n=1 Tax=Leptospira yasudae TaxID=2202201 RepID=A0A6N4QT03_9LEPT|nr:DUF1566 domain-containing protein [Leptospira yasudae]TGL76934.1 DUF1566 domain-containing protein [Leptospira yasudae]TGL79696.1 DUF1566 domain-containing protein [Leptospira yasudae]TGL82405.1 DUF1566 domain-containing protein [Leptospira yasudae]